MISHERHGSGRPFGDDHVALRAEHVTTPREVWAALTQAMRARQVFLGVRGDRVAEHVQQAEVVIVDGGSEGFGLLAAQVRPFDVAVITVASIHPEAQTNRHVGALLEGLQSVVRPQGVRALAQVGWAPWLTDAIQAHGFRPKERVVTYEWYIHSVDVQGNLDVTVTAAKPEDMAILIEMDRALFGPVWHKGPAEFHASCGRAYMATVAMLDGRIVGYEWCDRVGESAHLTRLGVGQEWQHRGIGTRLLTATLRQLVESGVKLVTLNTQEGNLAAHRLYRHFGFLPLDERVDLLWKDLSISHQPADQGGGGHSSGGMPSIP